jgi:hypothetical protein
VVLLTAVLNNSSQKNPQLFSIFPYDKIAEKQDNFLDLQLMPLFIDV